MVTQPYEAEADNEYVIRGNSVAMKCEIPSFVADFVSVLNWNDSDGNEFLPGEEIGTFPALFSDQFSLVLQFSQLFFSAQFSLVLQLSQLFFSDQFSLVF